MGLTFQQNQSRKVRKMELLLHQLLLLLIMFFLFLEGQLALLL